MSVLLPRLNSHHLMLTVGLQCVSNILTTIICREMLIRLLVLTGLPELKLICRLNRFKDHPTPTDLMASHLC